MSFSTARYGFHLHHRDTGGTELARNYPLPHLASVVTKKSTQFGSAFFYAFGCTPESIEK